MSEYALVKSVNDATAPYPHTQILLQSNLLNCYDRNSATVNANVALATNGRSVSEIMGSGSASTPNQEFTLKQSPLTYVQAPTPTGRQSTLQVLANGAAWSEVPSLYQQSSSAQVFATLNQSDGTTDVLFGDGVEGATLPTGQNNLQANYRIGLGSAGNVAAGAISTLIDRPLGVSGVTNPQAATGGGDPDSIDDIRSSAPQSVLTLGRAVSIADYQSYASTFAGIAKAYAMWIPSGPGRGVFLTVAGADGAALPPGNPTLANLVASLQNYGNPLVPITAVTFLETLFGLSADIAYDSAYNQPAVQAAVLETLTETYSFANRTFGQGVSADEVCAVIQAVPGVVAVNVTELQAGPTSAAGDLASQGTFSISTFNGWLSQQVTNLPRPASGSNLRICPYIPVASSQGLPPAGGDSCDRSQPEECRSGSDVMTPRTRLFDLLPALYRLKDAQVAASQQLAQGPLQALLALIEEQLAVVANDLEQLYDDQFIETCAPWVIPYIGDLIGYQPVHGVAPAVASPRAEVAHTISFRRRKGTVLVLEQLARDVTGWGAHAVEFFKSLACSQYMNHIRPRNHYAPDLRRWQVQAYMDTGL